jgi:uncharacterized membrane protein
MSIPRDDNPFAPPRAAVLEAERADGEFIAGGRKVASGRGIAWFGEGWQIFKSAPGTWVAMFLIFSVISIVLAIIPLGSLVSSLCFDVVIGGVMIGCRTLEEGGKLQVAHLFAGFRKNTGSLLLLGVLYLVGVMLIGFFAGVAMALSLPWVLGPNFNINDFSSVMAMAPWIALFVLVMLALMMPLIMAVWFAPALVVFHDAQPIAAMRSSFQGCLRNFMPFLAYGIVGLLLGILALVPVGLGLLVFGPVLWGTMYAGYRDIFVRPA